MSAPSKNQLSRRDVIKAALAGIGGLVGALMGLPSGAYLLSPAWQAGAEEAVIPVGALDKYRIGIPIRFDFMRTKVNGWERTAINYGLYIVRTGESDVRVFSDICTHLGCRVTWHADQEHYISPCHNGHFDRLGNVVSGPPPRPLDEFTVKIENGNLFVNLPPFKRNG